MRMGGEIEEVDNCPVCNTTVTLKHGLPGAFEEIQEEVCSATCEICGTKFRRRDVHSNRGSIAVYEKWRCFVPKINLKIVEIGPFWCGWKKVKEKNIPTGHE